MTDSVIAAGGQHLEDGALMQMLDGESAPEDARAHLAACERCTAQLATIEHAAGVLRSSLPAVDPPPFELPPPRRRARWLLPVPLAAAATLLVLASAAAATPAVREWLRSRISNASPAAPRPGNPDAPPVATPPAAPRVIVSFAPLAPELIIRIDHRQAQGSLHLVEADGDKVTAQALGKVGIEELQVMPSAIRVANSTASVVDYRFDIPTSIRIVRVMIGGNETAVVAHDGRLDRRIPIR